MTDPRSAHRRHVHYTAEDVERLKQSSPAWRRYFELSDERIAAEVEAAGGWAPFMREQQTRLNEAAARAKVAGENYTHIATYP